MAVNMDLKINSACSIYSGCQNCTYAGCVWCGTQYGCHDHLSPYGCLYSQPCANITACMRQTPQIIPEKDYQAINPVIIVITLLVSLLFLVCIWTLFWFFRNHRKQPSIAQMLLSPSNDPIPTPAINNPMLDINCSASPSQSPHLIDNNYDLINNNNISTNINNNINNDSNTNYNRWPWLSNNHTPINDHSKNMSNNDSLTSSQKLRSQMRNKYNLSSNRSAQSDSTDVNSKAPSIFTHAFTTLSSIPRTDTPSQVSSISKGHRGAMQVDSLLYSENLHNKHAPCRCCVSRDICTSICFWIAVIISICILILGCVVCLFFPSMPTYYVCNQKTDWASIWDNLEHGSTAAEYQVLLTYKNNNYFRISIENVGLKMYYQSSLIGYWYPKDKILLPTHSYVDILSQITFMPSVTQVYNIYEKWEHNALYLDLEFTGYAKAYLLDTNIMLYSMSLDLNMPHYKEGISVPTDRTGCACPSDQ